jgi:PAS domain S-box-containing protein
MYDVTERRNAEQDLIQSEEKYRSVVENIGIGVAVISPKMEILALNNQMRKWFPNIEDSKNPICYKSFNRPPREHVCSYCPTTKSLRDGQVHQAVTETPSGDEVVNYRIVSSPIKDNDGKVIAAIEMVEDVTEHERAEKALRESEEKYRLVIENARDITYSITPEGTLMFIGPQVASLGYSVDEVVGHNIREFVHPDDIDRVLQELARTLATGETRATEFRLLRKDGGYVFVEETGSVLCEGNKIIQITGSIRDVTERKKTEDELLFKSTLLEAQSETSIEGILLVDGEGKSILYNKRFGQMWNIPQKILDTRDDEKMLQYVLDQLKDPNRFLDKVTYLYAHKNEESRDEIQFKDGKVFDRYSSPLIDSNGKHYGRIWYFGDITERKQAEEALRESEQRHKALFEGAAEGILVADIQTRRFLYANPAICRMLGYTAEELTQMSVENVHPADSLEHVLAEFEAQVKGEKTLAPGLPCLRKDGAIMYADINTAKISIGGRECNVGFFTDITERRKAELALQKAHDELEIRVKQRTSDLARANQQLLSLASELSLAEERLRRQIATNVHDHIGQNLAISKIKLESLRESVSSPKLTALLNEIRELIGQTIESSRSLTFELSPPVLYELGFEAAVEWLVRNTRQKHGLSTDFQSDGRPKPLSFNVRVLLFQAVRELLVNIAKHANARNVTVWTRRVDDQVQVTVEDDGVGFDTSRLGSHTNQTEGFGLFSIRERLGYIGGSLDVDSRPGLGTRVTLVTPIEQEGENDKEKNK